MNPNHSKLEQLVLSNPESFCDWWSDRETEGFTSERIADELEKIGTPLSALRAALVLGYSEEVRERIRTLAGIAIGYGDPTENLFGLGVIAILEGKVGYHLANGELRATRDTLVLLETLLEASKQSTNRSPLLSELEARLHRAIGECALINGEYDRARRHLVLAIAMGQGLRMHGFVQFARLFLANVAVNAGAMAEARSHYGQLISDVHVTTEIVVDAQVFTAMSFFWSGEDSLTLEFINQILSQHPSNYYVESYCNALKVFIGAESTVKNPEESKKHLPNGLFVIQEVFRCIWQAERKHSSNYKQALIEGRQLLELMRPSGNLANAMTHFLKGLIAYRLGEATLATRAVQSALKIESIPSVRVLVLGLALELAIDWNGFELIRSDDLTADIAAELGKLSSSARRDMAKRFALLLPKAGAFISVSPYAEGEFQQVLTDSILDVSTRPIKALGSAGLRPAHAVQFTLEGFGFEVPRAEGGGQLAAEETILKQPIGNCEHWFEVVPPALLIFCLLRTHEQVTGASQIHRFSPWKHSAGEVARRYGVLPKYNRGPYASEISILDQHLRLLLAGETTPSEFRRVVGHRALLDSRKGV